MKDKRLEANINGNDYYITAKRFGVVVPKNTLKIKVFDKKYEKRAIKELKGLKAREVYVDDKGYYIYLQKAKFYLEKSDVDDYISHSSRLKDKHEVYITYLDNGDNTIVSIIYYQKELKVYC
jgi:hypothetical protein